MVNLKHSQIDILKIDAPIDSVHSYEILHFLVADSLLSKVKELHFVLKLGKLICLFPWLSPFNNKLEVLAADEMMKI